MDDALRAACARAVHVIAPDGERIRAGRAVLLVMETLGTPGPWSLLARKPWVWMVEAVYTAVAVNRGLLGRLFLPRDAGCPPRRNRDD